MPLACVDLSKFHPIEFFESIKYADGKCSPIIRCKADKGYSIAWLHHKSHNKHHLEYWIFPNSTYGALLIPYNYQS